MTNIKALGLPLLAAIAWSLTIALVSRLLGGTFDERWCTTACMQAIYWAAFATAVVGTALGSVSIRHQCDAKNLVSLAALAGLLLVFLTTMAVGTFARHGL